MYDKNNKIWTLPYPSAGWYTAPYKTEQEFIDNLVLRADAGLYTLANNGMSFYNLLHQAIICDYQRALESLLQMNVVDIHAPCHGFPGGRWRRPLHDAVVFNKRKCAEILLQYGADPALPDSDGKRVLHHSRFVSEWYLAVPSAEELNLI
jgi:hypothetical protein